MQKGSKKAKKDKKRQVIFCRVGIAGFGNSAKGTCPCECQIFDMFTKLFCCQYK